MRGVLNVLNEIAPGSNLRTYIHELSKDSQQEARVAQQIAEAAVAFSRSKRLSSNLRKPCQGDKQGPENRDRAKDHVRRNDSHRLAPQIGGVSVRRLHVRDLITVQFDP